MVAYIDTHAHYFVRSLRKLDGGVEGLTDSDAFRSAVRAVINVGLDPASNVKAVEQAARYPFMVAAVGIHPKRVQGSTKRAPLDPDATLKPLRAYLSDEEKRCRDKVVAIGEFGLDYHWQPADKARQQVFFDGQMEIAHDLGLPAIIHDRDADEDSLATVSRYPEVRGVFHCYRGSLEVARELVRLGWYLSFGGAVTYEDEKIMRDVIRLIPPDRILLETDCPYLAPVPHRFAPNHSGYLPLIANAVARLCGMTTEELAAVTGENAERLFGLSRFVPL